MDSAIGQWETLRPELELIYEDIFKNCPKSKYMKLYTQIYIFYTKSFNEIKSDKISHPKYKEFYQLMLDFLNNINGRLVYQIPHISSLNYFVTIWSKYYRTTGVVNNIFDYFNRTYIEKLENYGKGDYYY